MSRPLELVVEPYRALSPGKHYPMRVIAIRKEAAALEVVLEHIANDQAGRQHEVFLGLPLRPQSPSARFFVSLGCDASIGSRIRPADAVSRELIVQFSASSEGEEPQPVAFHPIPEK